MSDELLNVILRHQVYLEGLKGGKNREFVKTIALLDQALKRDLAFIQFENLGDMTKRDLALLLRTLKKTTQTIFDVYLSELIRWLEDYMQVDSEFWQFAYGLTGEAKVEQFDKVPEKEKLFALISLMPMGANGLLMIPMLKAFAALSTVKVANKVTQAWVNKAKKEDLIKALFGSKKANLNDGLMAELVRQGASASNTVVQHIAANTNAAVAKVVWDRYQWVSVLDQSTTQICLSRNGLIWAYGDGPVPPAHVGCRSSIVPVTGAGPLDGMPSYKVWAMAQSDEFKQDAFDGKPGARYEGSKPINLDEFEGKRRIIVS